MILNGKHILIGITGGIAAYKICYLIRSIKKQGGSVKVILTEAGEQFVTKTTLETLTGEPVHSQLFEQVQNKALPHIELARWADCFVIAPATANIIAKSACGIADDLLSTVILSYNGVIIFAPAMNENMWNNPVTQENVKKLKDLRHWIVTPGVGELACDMVGVGRMAEPEEIERVLYTNLDFDKKGRLKDLLDKRVLITLGRTEEPIDPVRYISNRSSGKMGAAIAEATLSRGAEVTIIAGVHTALLQPGADIITVRTAQGMMDAVKSKIDKHDVLLMAAAVTDYRPVIAAEYKIKKGAPRITIELEQTEDILETISRREKRPILVGFSVETENVIKNARRKLKEKNLDIIVVNNPLEPGAGFETDTNRVTLIEPGKKPVDVPLLPKRIVADYIIDHIVPLLQ